ncbi:uncharacterized protein LOC144861353 [Branchiostoma floridae x Branchiostoma japonicum]
MPIDLVKLTGTWKLANKSGNLVEVLQKLGDQPQLSESEMETVEVQVEYKMSDNTVTRKIIVNGSTIESTYTLGIECEEPGTPNRKVTYTIEGDALVVNYPNHDGKGLVVRKTHRFVSDKALRTDYKVGDLEGWYEAKKI